MRAHARLWRCGWAAALGLALALSACDDDSLDIQFPTPVNDHWWDGFGSQGLSDYVDVLGEYQGNLVAGGQFLRAGSVAAPGIARWNGTEWSAFGSGMHRDDCTSQVCTAWVATLATFQGDLIAGGRFTEAGGARAANVARWNGSAWSPLGAGFDNTVFTLAVYEGTLVAGGIFTRSGTDSTVQHLARWDGTAWRSFAGGTNGAVRVLLPWGSKLVAGGDFTVAGADTAEYVAIWDGAAWTAPRPFLDRSVRAAIVFQGALVVAGDFYGAIEAGGYSIHLGHVASWTGSEWVELGEGVDDDATALAIYNGKLVVGGSMTRSRYRINSLARWDGQYWVGFGSGLDRRVESVLARDGHLYAGGWFRQAGQKPSRFIARWEE